MLVKDKKRCDCCGNENITISELFDVALHEDYIGISCDNCGRRVKQYKNGFTQVVNVGDKTKCPTIPNVKENDTNVTYKEFYEREKSVIDHIKKAYVESLRNGIKANMIIIDEEVARSNKILLPNLRGGIDVLPPMIFGLEISYQKDLAKEIGVNFAITQGNTTVNSEIERLKRENEELREKLKKITGIIDGE